MKKIHIFLASSLEEFASERIVIENFIRRISDDFEEKYQIKICPLLCENTDDVYSVCRKQEEYNQSIRESDFCFFIFFTKVGKYTKEEFEVAEAQFRKSGKPKIYTYFKNLEEGQAEQGLYDFMETLSSSFGHYYSTFSHIDTIKLRILLSLKLQEMDFLELTIEDGRCLADGKAILAVDQVSEFANNDQLAALQAALDSLEEEYYPLKAACQKEGCSEEQREQLKGLAAKRQALKEEIDGLQERIFRLSLQMIRDDAKGEISARQKKAYHLFEHGEYEGCMAILSSAELEEDFLQSRQKLKEQESAICLKYIREQKTAIEILQLMKEKSDRFEEIEGRYAKMLPLMGEMKIAFDILPDYLAYLADQNQDQKAIAVAEEFLPLCTNDADRAPLLGRLAASYSRLSMAKEAEKAHLEAIALYEKLEQQNPQGMAAHLAGIYNNAAIFFKERRRWDLAQRIYLRAIALIERSEGYGAEKLIDLSNNVAIVYERMGELERAEKSYLFCLKLLERLAKEDPSEEGRLAIICKNLADFYYEREQFEKVEALLRRARVLLEGLSKENPDRYEGELAACYDSYARYLARFKKGGDLPERLLLEEVRILERLEKGAPMRFAPALARAFFNAGLLKTTEKKEAEALIFYLRAAIKWEELSAQDPEQFEPRLAEALWRYGRQAKDAGKLHRAFLLAKAHRDDPECEKIYADLKKFFQ